MESGAGESRAQLEPQCIAHFDQSDIPSWTLEYPALNPLAAIALEAPAQERTPRHAAVSWTERGIRKQDFEWTDAGTSLQWRSFRRAVEILRRRKNRLVVVVGPFNEHMLAEEGRNGCERIRSASEEWLARSGIPHIAPPPLPSELYADASHPLAEGYARLARELLASPEIEALRAAGASASP